MVHSQSIKEGSRVDFDAFFVRDGIRDIFLACLLPFLKLKKCSLHLSSNTPTQEKK